MNTESDAILLPWWKNPANILIGVVVVAIFLGSVGYSVGNRAGRVQHNSVDVGFLQDMRIHHEQAVAMASVYLDIWTDGNSVERTIAREIQFDQSFESGRMVQLLRIFGESEVNETDLAMTWMNETDHAMTSMHDPVPLERMPGLATDEQLQELRRAKGVEADKLFAQLMIAHHNGGLDMAKYAVEHGQNKEVLGLAAAMVAAQTSEVVELNRILSSL
ncbi:MAG: DUF305 domain-containing protein [Ilumatobacteraceae bacterium]|nr:DUF305 domain-containing protein [Ilumatobacteraceae bacterium]